MLRSEICFTVLGLTAFLGLCATSAGATPVESPLAGNSDCGWAHGFHQRGFNNEVNDIIAWDDGSGLALYAGGEFSADEDRELFAIARWDGSFWHPLLCTGGGGFAQGDEVYALAVWENGPSARFLV